MGIIWGFRSENQAETTDDRTVWRTSPRQPIPRAVADSALRNGGPGDRSKHSPKNNSFFSDKPLTRILKIIYNT